MADLNPNPDPTKHAEIPVWNMETWLYEDIVVGERSRSIRRTISEGEVIAFGTLIMDLHPYVADDPFAVDEGMFGRRLVAGAQVFSYGLAFLPITTSTRSATATIGYALSDQSSLAIPFTASGRYCAKNLSTQILD